MRNEEILLREPRADDYAEWRAVRLESRPFLKPFEPRWTESDLKKTVFQSRLSRARKEKSNGTEFSFFIFVANEDQHQMVGGITLSNIRRRVAQQVNIGYWMAVNAAGKGIMTRAVATVLPFIFEDLDLHRVHAACLPDNIPSRRVLEKNGFCEEGFAKHYLQIDGDWRDHVLYGLTKEQYQPTDVSV